MSVSAVKVATSSYELTSFNLPDGKDDVYPKNASRIYVFTSISYGYFEHHSGTRRIILTSLR